MRSTPFTGRRNEEGSLWERGTAGDREDLADARLNSAISFILCLLSCSISRRCSSWTAPKYRACLSASGGSRRYPERQLVRGLLPQGDKVLLKGTKRYTELRMGKMACSISFLEYTDICLSFLSSLWQIVSAAFSKGLGDCVSLCISLQPRCLFLLQCLSVRMRLMAIPLSLSLYPCVSSCLPLSLFCMRLYSSLSPILFLSCGA